MMGHMDAVFFDIDDTLYDQARPFAYAVRRVMGHRVVPATNDQLYTASRTHSCEVFAALGAGRKPSVETYVRRMKATLADFGVTISDAEAREMQLIYAADSWRAMRLFPGLPEVLRLCRERSRVGVISNGRERSQLAKLDVLGIARYARPASCVISEAVGVSKPDPAIFRIACERLDAQPENCLYVGDAYAIDVVGALAANMAVAWFNHRRRERPDGPEPTYEARSGDELLSLIKDVL